MKPRSDPDNEAFGGGIAALLTLIGFGLFALSGKCDIDYGIGDVTNKNREQRRSDKRAPLEFM